MSPVFRHGGLRLYLLKLLDEEPRHGYDVIRLLQDRFLGVYSPSPGTIYPRLARLEEEGLVTHDVVDGKKVYKITDAGRDELSRRFDDLADLEDELAASVRDIARELSRDVRETVRNLRDEFTWAVREAGRAGREPGQQPPTAAADSASATPTADGVNMAKDTAGTSTDERTAAADAGGAWGRATSESEEEPGADRAAGTGPRGERSRERPGRGGGWREWADWAERRDWREWAAWAEQQDWREWAGRQDWQEWKDRARASQQDFVQRAKATRQEWSAGQRGRRREADLAGDLERLAAAFARELRGVAWQAGALSEDAVANLGRILTDALNRIKTEVFEAPAPDAEGSESEQKPGAGPANDRDAGR